MARGGTHNCFTSLQAGILLSVKDGHKVYLVDTGGHRQLAHVVCVQVTVLVGNCEVKGLHGVPSDGVVLRLHSNLRCVIALLYQYPLPAMGMILKQTLFITAPDDLLLEKTDFTFINLGIEWKKIGKDYDADRQKQQAILPNRGEQIK